MTATYKLKIFIEAYRHTKFREGCEARIMLFLCSNMTCLPLNPCVINKDNKRYDFLCRDLSTLGTACVFSE